MVVNKEKLDRIKKCAELLAARLESCDICPRNCHVNRLHGQSGYCQAGENAVVYTAFRHNGEEPGISHNGGSGTIFFSGCNLKCVYCQNHQFSHEVRGEIMTSRGLADLMLRLERAGADNINLVTPTHYLPQIAKALALAIAEGLSIPLVYNSSGYEKRDIIAALEGIVDVYLTDIKYIEDAVSAKYSHAPDYPRFCLESTREMYRQKTRCKTSGMAIREGLIIRHMVLPGQQESAKKILAWIKKNCPHANASIMFQYQPYFHAAQYHEINRRLNEAEYCEILDYAETVDLNGWIQEFEPSEHLAGQYFTPGLDKI